MLVGHLPVNGVEQQFGIADDGVNGGAEFVADVGEEFGFETIDVFESADLLPDDDFRFVFGGAQDAALLRMVAGTRLRLQGRADTSAIVRGARLRRCWAAGDLAVQFFLQADGAFEEFGEPADGGSNLRRFLETELAELGALGGIALSQFGHRHDDGDVVIDRMTDGAQVLIQRFHLRVELFQLLVAVLCDALVKFCCGFHDSLFP